MEEAQKASDSGEALPVSTHYFGAPFGGCVAPVTVTVF